MLSLTYIYDIYCTDFEKRLLPSACDKSCLETMHSLQGETWKTGKSKLPCTARGCKLWPHAAPEQRTPHRCACGPARHQPKSAHASEKYRFVVFPTSNCALPTCCRAQHRHWNTSAVSDVTSVDVKCLHSSSACQHILPCLCCQCSSTTLGTRAPEVWFQLQAGSVPVLVMCGSYQHVARETEWTACTPWARFLGPYSNL